MRRPSPRLLLPLLLAAWAGPAALTAAPAPPAMSPLPSLSSAPIPPGSSAGPASHAAPAPFFQLTEIGPGVFAAVDGPDGRSGANAGFIIGDDGVVVVDSFFNPEAAQALLAEIRRRTDKPVRFVVNTHYHVDHTAGDGVFRAAGALVLARREVHDWIRTENLHLLGRALTPERRALVENLVLPDVGVTGPTTLWLGSRRIDLRPANGHTGGDLVVVVPDAHAVFCGDLFWRRIPPNTIDGRLGLWILDLKTLETGPGAEAAVFVPGHGGLGRVGDVRAARTYLEALRTEVEAARAAGLKGAALKEQVLERLKSRYGGYEAFSAMAPREVSDAEAEADGVKPFPKARP